LIAVPLGAAKKSQETRQRPEQLAGEIVRYQHHQRRLQALGQRPLPAVNADVGAIAVIEDDGTLFFPQNLFDLDNRSVTFTPQSNGGYLVAAGGAAFDQSAADTGQRIILADDDTRQIALGFSFPFFDQTYTAVYLNSDGNLTFNDGDVAITERDLGRFLSGEPRIAPYFQDLNPEEGGRVTVSLQASRATFSWVSVPLCCIGVLPAPIARQTFQVTLFSDGRIQFAYAGVQDRTAVVGISPGHVGAGGSLVDFSQQTGLGTVGPVAEVFITESQFCVICTVQAFYKTHEDAYDLMLLWTNFSYLSGNSFALAGPVRNDITGVQGIVGVNTPNNIFDFAREIGSKNGRLQGLTQMEDLGKYPSDPRARIGAVPPNNTLSVMGQELGHRWLAFLRYPFGGIQLSDIILGRDEAHWSFFFNSEGSVMEGNAISDNGNGTFTTGEAVNKYSTLDQYVMGLRGPEEVNPSFVVLNATGTSRTASSSPQAGLTFSGTRLEVTMDQVIAANGTRFPPAALEQRDYNFAFVLVGQRGAPPASAQIAKLDTIRQAWEETWPQYLDNRSKARTAILKGAGIYPLPAATGTDTTIAATLTLDSPAPAGGVTFQMASSDSGVARVPATVTVAAGATQAAFNIQAAGEGIARVSGTAAGYQPLDGAVQVSRAGAATNGASFAVGAPVTPGSIVSVFGSNFAAAPASASSVPLPVTLGSTSVTIGGVPAPLFFVSPNQINLQVPFTVIGSYAPLVVSNGGATAATLPLLLSRASPGLFTASQDGKGAAAVLHAADGAPVTASAPARAGEFLSIFASGLGAVAPAVASGAAASGTSLSRTRQTPTVTIGGRSAPVSFSGLAPGFVGLYQVNVQVPAGVSGAALPLVVTLRGVASNTATLVVQ
jgi:uncharacterized protein (TIGR03437 family)